MVGGLEKRRRGRPRKDHTKSERLDVRLTPEEAEMLEFIRQKRGVSKTQIVSEALKTAYNLAKFT